MEEVLHKTLSENIQDETINQSQGSGELESTLSSTPVKNENLDLNGIEETIQGLNGHAEITSETFGDCESGNESVTSEQKAFSPTLIESAFKVMKNLFSPNKTKNKTANVLSPVKQNGSTSGSPSSSIYTANKAELATLDTGIENPLTVQTGENSIKNQLNMNQVGVLFSPVPFESHNNTDESFLTTVSIIDDSFHSAITNLDENGEAMKLEANVMENCLNSTQNSDVGDAYNDTLENTTLRNGSFVSEGNKVSNLSVLSKDGSADCWSSLQFNDGSGSFLNDCKETPVVDVQYRAPKEDHCNDTVQRIDSSVDGELLENGHPNDDDNAGASPEEKLTGTLLQTGIQHELNNPARNLKMENIFLNKSFDASVRNFNSADGSSACIYENDVRALNGVEKIFESDCCDRSELQESEFCFENSSDERGACVENSISTTTVVLNSVDSVDLDNILMSLKDISDSNTISSQISFTGSIETASTLSENMSENQFSKEYDHFLPVDSVSRNIGISEATSLPLHKPQKNKSSVSERDSSSASPNLNKIKLHKSDELIRRRMSNDSLEGKRMGHQKSSLDVSLMKNSEASKNSETGPNFTNEFGTSELNVHVKERFQDQDTLEKDLAPNEQATLSVISQQSYTILTSHDKSLNRPIIEPMNFDKGLPEKQTFQATDLTTAGPPEKSVLESCAPTNYCNGSFGVSESETPSHQKHSTPLWKGNMRHSPSENCQSLVKPILLNLDSSKGSPDEEKREMEHPSVCSTSEVLGKTIQMFNSNEDPAEFSPVIPNNENELSFSNLTESEIEGNRFPTMSGPNSTRILSPNDPREDHCPTQPSDAKGLTTKNSEGGMKETQETVCNLNQTFSKNLDSPQPHKLNQTYDKKPKSDGSTQPSRSSEEESGCEKLNLTFDKCAGPSSATKSNKTFTKETESLEIQRTNETFNISESPECNDASKTFNKTFVSRAFNQKPGSSVPQNSGETIGKRSQSPLLSKIDQMVGTRSGSPVPGISEQTFVKEKEFDINQEKTVQENNKTFDLIPGSGTSGVNNVAGGETQEDGIEKVFDRQTEAVKCPNEDMPLEQSFDQQVSDYIDGCHRDMNGSFISGRSSSASLVGSELSTLLNEESLSRNQSIDDLAGKLGKLNLNESSNGKPVGSGLLGSSGSMLNEDNAVFAPKEDQVAFPESGSPSDDKLRCDPYLVQLIQEQFSSNDIEKICSVVDDLSAIKLSSQILKASEQFDKSFHENLSFAESKPTETEAKPDKFVNPLSPKSFDFLNSIQGKPTGRDWSRESLYVKFDPLVQPNPNSLIDFTKEGEALSTAEKSPVLSHDSSVCEQLLAISPQKKPDDIVPPLTPLSHRSKAGKPEDKAERVKELQNEIYFLKNLYAERERANKAKMEDYESQVAKLTGESCFLEDKLKESNEREKALVKKMKEQTQSLGQLKVIMEEYGKVISKLTAELEALKSENQKQIEALSSEKDSYMTHLQNTEAAFTDVHLKYEKSKKTIASLKTNEVMYRNTIAEQAQKMEDFKSRAREVQEKAFKEFQKIQEELGESKASHNQETARLRAQLRKTELKVEALQESLEQKIKENQQLTAICDELIEGKK